MKTLAKISGVLALLVASQVNAGELVVIVNDANPVTAMTSSEVKQHYLKSKTRWEFGQKIRPADSTYDDDARNAFLARVLNMTDLEIERFWIEQQYVKGGKPPATLDDDSSVMRFVAKFDGAISFVPRASLNGVSGVKEVLTVSY